MSDLVVWKFEIPMDDYVEINMPINSKILHVTEQRGIPTMWALVNPRAEKIKRKFRIAGTGHQIKTEDTANFIGTIMLDGGSLMFHIFEIK